jgi:hypothetical protein
MADATGHGHGGSYAGGVTLGAASLLNSDPTDHAVTFDGVSGVGVGPHIAPSNPNVFTLECWFSTPTVAGVQALVCLGAGDPLLRVSGNQLQALASFVANVCNSGTAAVAPHTTYHAVWTKAGAVNHLYLNGVDVTANVTDNQFGVPALGDVLSIGQDNHSGGGGSFFGGVVDEVAVYDFALTATQVATNYANGTGALSAVAYCATPATLRLELVDHNTGAVTDSLDLMDQNNGYRVATLDVAFPTVRAVVAPLPTRDGDYDTTNLFGPRVVTVTGSLVHSAQGSRQVALATLARWCGPRLRPRLVYAVDSDATPLALGLRGSQLSAPAANPAVSAFTASWEAPDPVATGLTQHANLINPQPTALGRHYNLSFNRVYPVVTGNGQGSCVNAGTYRAWPVLNIYGPCTNPAVFWISPPGGAVVFSGLTLQANEYVQVDTYAQTVLDNGQAGASRFDLLDFARTSWAGLEPGSTTLQYLPDSVGPGCHLVVSWYDSSI